MAEGTGDTGVVRKGRGMRVVLFASLALNLLVVGAVAGFLVMGPPGPPHDRPGGDDPALPYTRALTEDQRRDLRGALRGEVLRDRQEMRAIREGVITGYREALGVLRADPYDPAALEALMAAQAERSAAVRVRGQKVLSDYVAGMSAAERAAYADRLEETLAKFQRKRDRGTGRFDGKPFDGPKRD